RMFHHDSPAVQELAGYMFERNAHWASEIPTATFVDLAFHEIRSIRSAAMAMFSKILHRFERAFSETAGDELYSLIRVLDSPWDDGRPFWFQMFQGFLAPGL